MMRKKPMGRVKGKIVPMRIQGRERERILGSHVKIEPMREKREREEREREE